MRTIRLAVVLVLAASSWLLLPSPASAHAATSVVAFSGSMQVVGGSCRTNGPLLPVNAVCPDVVGPFDYFQWSFASNHLDVMVSQDLDPPLGTNRVLGTGSFLGYCEAMTGSGIFGIGTHTIPVVFTAVGGTGLLLGLQLDSHVGNVASIFHLRPLPSAVGSVPCVTEGASQLHMVGVASLALRDAIAR